MGTKLKIASRSPARLAKMSRCVFPILSGEDFFFLENSTILGRKLENLRRLSSEDLFFFFFEEQHDFGTKIGKSRISRQIYYIPKKIFLLDRRCLSGIPPIQIWQPYFQRTSQFITLKI